MKHVMSLPVRYPKTTLIISIALLLLAGVYGFGIFGKLSSDDRSFNAIGTESDVVDKEVKQKFGTGSATSLVLFTAKQSDVKATDETFRNEVTSLLGELRPMTQTTYYETGDPSLISRDKSATYAAVTLDGDNTTQAKKLLSFMKTARSDIVDIKVGGVPVGQYESIKQTQHDLELAELISLPIVALLLLLFFRSVTAALLPLITAGLTICGALAVAHWVQQFTPIDTYTINIITILGLGLSVDYSLLAVNRFREELALSKSAKAAALTTAKTAGRTIMFSAFTVIICILSLLIFPVGFMHSIAVGGAAAVFVAMILSLIVVPALFALLGRNIDRLKLPLPSRPASQGNIWHRLARIGVDHPLATLAVGVVIVAVFSWPILHVENAEFDYKVLPNNSNAFAVGKALDQSFDTKAASITVLATYDKVPTPVEMCRTVDQLKSLKGVDSVTAPYMSTAQLTCDQLAMLEMAHMTPESLHDMSTPMIHDKSTKLAITPTSGPNDPSTAALIDTLRNRTDTGVTYHVGGTAPLSHDALASYTQYTPYVVAVIIVTMLLVLTFSLGSIVIPLQSIVINSLGLLIAVGSLIMMYQFGWFESLIHQTVMGGLNPSIPILVCVIAFGLSMDYAVFLYSRMHEIHDKTGDYREAILQGVEKTGPIITAAALVFFAVVAVFAISKISMMQQIGFGLAIAVIVDAFVIRILFVPAIMQLFGRLSWYAPQWIKRHTVKHE